MELFGLTRAPSSSIIAHPGAFPAPPIAASLAASLAANEVDTRVLYLKIELAAIPQSMALNSILNSLKSRHGNQLFPVQQQHKFRFVRTHVDGTNSFVSADMPKFRALPHRRSRRKFVAARDRRTESCCG